MELFRALAALLEPPGPATPRLAALLGLPAAPTAAEHTELFSLQLYPYAAVHAGAEGMLGGEAADRVAGFWRALGLTPPAEPDHLAALLQLHAAIAEREAAADGATAAAWRHRRHALFWEHLASWLVPWLARLPELAPPAYRAWGALLASALVADARSLGPPAALPLHLREAPALPELHAASLEELTAALLAPARSGLLMARADLARLAREQGLGLRLGERRFALRQMLAQDAAATAQWLAAEARRQAGRLGTHPLATVALQPIPEFWASRAEATAAALEALAPTLADFAHPGAAEAIHV